MDTPQNAMSIALNMMSNRNVEEVVLLLKTQSQKTQKADYEKV